MNLRDVIFHYAVVEYPDVEWRVSFNDETNRWEIGCTREPETELVNTYEESFFVSKHSAWYQTADSIRFAIFETFEDAKEQYEHRRKQNTETTR